MKEKTKNIWKKVGKYALIGAISASVFLMGYCVGSTAKKEAAITTPTVERLKAEPLKTAIPGEGQITLEPGYYTLKEESTDTWQTSLNYDSLENLNALFSDQNIQYAYTYIPQENIYAGYLVIVEKLYFTYITSSTSQVSCYIYGLGNEFSKNLIKNTLNPLTQSWILTSNAPTPMAATLNEAFNYEPLPTGEDLPTQYFGWAEWNKIGFEGPNEKNEFHAIYKATIPNATTYEVYIRTNEKATELAEITKIGNNDVSYTVANLAEADNELEVWFNLNFYLATSVEAINADGGYNGVFYNADGAEVGGYIRYAVQTGALNTDIEWRYKFWINKGETKIYLPKGDSSAYHTLATNQTVLDYFNELVKEQINSSEGQLFTWENAPLIYYNYTTEDGNYIGYTMNFYNGKIGELQGPIKWSVETVKTPNLNTYNLFTIEYDSQYPNTLGILGYIWEVKDEATANELSLPQVGYYAYDKNKSPVSYYKEMFTYWQGYTSTGDYTSIFAIIGLAFSGLGTLMTLAIAPGITIGLLIAIPLMVSLLLWLLTLIKK